MNIFIFYNKLRHQKYDITLISVLVMLLLRYIIRYRVPINTIMYCIEYRFRRCIKCVGTVYND